MDGDRPAGPVLHAGPERHFEIKPDLSVTGGHVFQGIKLSENARALFGDVYTSCSDLMHYLTPDQERKALANALRYQGMHNRLSSIISAAPKTCEWIWQTSFETWLRDLASSKTIFWISGKPGSGKSTLMKYLIAAPQTQELLRRIQHQVPWNIAHFFFDFRAAQTLANTEDGMFRSILYQILCKCPIPREALAQNMLNVETVLDTLDLEKTITMIGRILESEKIRILMLVDGLDECGSNLRLMIGSLLQLSQRTNIRLCLASRPEPIIQILLKDCPLLWVHDYNQTAINSYVIQSLQDIALKLNLAESFTQSLYKELVFRADGVFLFAHFAVEHVVERLVQGCTEGEVLAELHALPQELNGTYERIFDRIAVPCRAEVALILNLLDSAKHKVSLDALYGAWLMVNRLLNNTMLNAKTTTLRQFRLRLQGFVGGIIEIKDQHEDDVRDANDYFSESLDYDTTEVRFTHETIRAYVRDLEIIRNWANPKHLEQLPTHLWAHLYSDTIIQAGKSLGRNIWSLLEVIGSELDSLGSSLHSEACRVNFLGFTATMLKALDKTFINGLSLPYFVKMLADALRYLDSAAASVTLDHANAASFQKITIALRSPLILCSDLFRDMPKDPSCKLTALCEGSRFLRHDLAFAAARNWQRYLDEHASELQQLTIDEKDLILYCSMTGAFTIVPKYMSFTVGPSQDRLLYLMYNNQPKQSRLLALYIGSYFYNEPPDWIFGDSQTKECPLGLVDQAIESFSFMGSIYGQRRGDYVLERWAGLVHMNRDQLRNRLDFLVACGATRESFRNLYGGNGIAHQVLDEGVRSQTFHSTLLKMSLLAGHGADFLQKDYSNTTVLEKARAFCCQRRQVNHHYLKIFEGFPGLERSTIVIPAEEFQSFEQLLDKLENSAA